MLTPSTMTRPSAGMARMIVPCLPRSLPCRTCTRSPLRSFILDPPDCSHLQHLRCQRDDAHELLVTQLATNRAEDAGAPGLLLVVDQHGRVLVKADIAAVRAALFLLGP